TLKLINMKPIFITVLLIFSSASLLAQTQSDLEYFVNVSKLNVRSGPGNTYEVIGSLKQEDNVTVITKEKPDWWYIEYGALKGFVASNFLVRDPYGDWLIMNYQSGDIPDNQMFEEEIDIEIDNYLKVNVGNNTDVLVKLMKI